GDRGGFAGVFVADFLRSSNEVPKLGGRVVRRDTTTLVTEQVLAILERHAGRAKPSSERVLQIVDSHPAKAIWRSFAALLFPILRSTHAGALPGRRVHLLQRHWFHQGRCRPRFYLWCANEHVLWMLPSHALHD